MGRFALYKYMKSIQLNRTNSFLIIYIFTTLFLFKSTSTYALSTEPFNIKNIGYNQIDTTSSDTTKTLSKKELKYLEREKKRELKDSLKFIKDSTRWSQPRILETYILPDSLKYKRIIIWNLNNSLNKISMIEPDTTFNSNFNEFPFKKLDVGATYLGISGSATQLHNYFLREKLDIFEPFEPYLVYSNTINNLPFYNVKTPYTELAYWGTLFSNREKEETNIKFLHTQNLSPSHNITVSYKRFGSAGQLARETTDNRTFALYNNYLGKRYVMHAGYIFNSIKRAENGGLTDPTFFLDSLVEETKELGYKLLSADNHLKRNTFFLTHSYGIPIRLSKADTLNNSGQGTTTYFGHSFEFSTFSKKYTDDIALNDSIGRAFYNNNFYLSPTNSFDSIRVSSFENKFFIRLQPWKPDAIISKLDGGVGIQNLSIYNFKPEFYTDGKKNSKYNNLYIYFGADGIYKNLFKWNAFSKYNISGYYNSDLLIDVNSTIFIPIKSDIIDFNARIFLENRQPNWFNQQYYSNHYIWKNDFSKITETKLEGRLNLPKYKLSIFAGYALIDNPIYYNNFGYAAQHPDIVTILSIYAQKNFKFGFLHLENRVLFQMSSNKEIIPLPDLSANMRYYIQFNLVKNVLTTQIGADITYNTEFYAQAYNPATGIFHNQNDRKIGNYPYIDAFVNLQWKRASIFVKYINAAEGWPSSDYFSAHNYIRSQTNIKFGIHWPFYVK